MHIEKLCEENVYLYLEYLRNAFIDEPDMMTTDCIDEQAIITRVYKNADQQSVSLLAMEGETVVGRLEYHFYSCMQDGYKMAYVNWVYVLKNHRKRGIARLLFETFEKECAANDVDEYFLIQAQNESARKFYHSFTEASSTNERILRKTLR